MRALVIGATGFLGLNLVDALLAQGTEVRATRRRRSITAYLRRRSVELVPASLEDEPALIEAMTGMDVAFLTGAHYPRYSTDRDASLLIAVTPAGFQDFFVELAAATPPEGGIPPMDVLQAIDARYGITTLGPPMFE